MPPTDTSVRRALERPDRIPTLSFEFFPPATPAAAERLRHTVDVLSAFDPDVVSVTYGAGGSTRDRTVETVAELSVERGLRTVAHLTGMGHRRHEVRALLDRYASLGVDTILALGGDAPADRPAEPGDFGHAIDLVEFLATDGRFSIGVAAHPEVHPRSPDRASDRRHLAAKLELADFAITQFFFEAHHHRRLVEELAALDCHRPVIAGVIPVTDRSQVGRFAELAGASVPSWVGARLEHDRTAGVEPIDTAAAIASELIEELLDGGAPGIHLYTLNRSEAVRATLVRLGRRASVPVG